MIVSTHELTYVQQGMLAQTLTSAESELYILQLVLDLNEDLDIQKFWDSWEIALERHPILRSSVRWRGVEKPRMEIHDQVELPKYERDLQGLSGLEQDGEISSFLEVDRKKGFSLESAPLLRLALFRLDESRYRFVRTCHHLISDGWSTVKLIKEVFEIYESLSKGSSLDLPSVRPFADYVNWLFKQDFEKGKSYWKNRLENLSALSLPWRIRLDQEESQVDIQDFGLLRFTLARPLAEDLKQLASISQVSLDVVLQTALAILLAFQNQNQDVVYGTTLAGRRTALNGHTDTIIGPLINVLPVRVLVDTEKPVSKLLSTLYDQLLKLKQYEHTPQSMIMEWLKRNPEDALFVCCYNYTLYDWKSNFQALGDAWLNRRGELIQYPPYPFALSVFEWPEISLSLSYQRNFYDDHAMSEFLTEYHTLLHSMASNPQSLIADLSILPESQRKKILYQWNDSKADYPFEKCAHQIFEDNARAHPNALALISGDVHVTYQELNQQANSLAHRLRALGIGSEMRVGIFLERSIEMVAAILAVLKSGAAYVPLDAEYPIDRLTYMLRDSDLKIILTSEELKERLPDGLCEIAALNRLKHSSIEHERLNEENLELTLLPDQLAYVIYTSGSSGQPKGVMVPHRGISNLITYLAARFEIRAENRILQFAPFSFDASVWDIWMALGNGAALVLADSYRMTGKELLTLLRVQKVDIITLLPSLLNILAEQLVDPNDLPNLETVIAASEYCTKETVDFWARGKKFFNGYGPTETTVCATVGKGVAGETLSPPIGMPVSNFRIYVLDQALRPVPPGVIGDLYISGVGLSRGYWNRPDLTAENFIPDPFYGFGERMYRSGDLARYREDGNLEFIGRSDQQVKLLGYRVELGEIEAILENHPSVQQVAVVLQEGKAGNRLIAYVTGSEGVQETDLRIFLESRLPKYMLPSRILMVETMPLTPNGKIDRKMLPNPLDLSKGDERHALPRDELEKELCHIWESILNVSPVGIYDRFFNLGGHSLIAIQLVNRIEHRLGMQCPIMVLLEQQTVAGLAEYLRQLPTYSDRPLGMKHRTVRKAPLSSGQAGLWLISKMDNLGAHYNIPAAFSLNGKLDILHLTSSFRTIAQRHDILRSIFIQEEGFLYQEILPVFEPNFEFGDVSGLPKDQQELELQRQAIEFGHKPFDLKKSPPWRLKLIRVNDENHLLLLCFFHILFDEWSLDVMYKELSELYIAAQQGRPAELPELTFQYSDYVFFQKEWLETKEADNQLSYWLGVLKNFKDLQKDLWDQPLATKRTFLGAFVDAELSQSMSMKIRHLSQSANVTTFSTLLSAFSHVLGSFMDDKEIWVGAPISNRQPIEFEHSIGYFLNTLLLRIDLSGNPNFREYQEKVNQTIIDAFENRLYPYEDLLQRLQSEHGIGNQPLFRILINYYPGRMPSLRLAGIDSSSISYDYGWSKFDYSLYISDSPESIRFHLVYNTDLVDKFVAECLIKCFGYYLENLHKYLETPIKNIPVLPPDERMTILNESHGPRAHIPVDLLIHHLFEAQAERLPETRAITFLDNSLSYKALNQKANQLAHFLQRRGVGLEKKVGILLPRSIEQIVCLLAVLKSGAAFVLLDPDLPPARLSNMINEADIPILLTRREHVHSLQDQAADPIKDIVFIDKEKEAIDDEILINPSPIATQDNLAYIFFTSGSTGHPKGVLTSHAGVVNYLYYLRDTFKFNEQTVALQITSISFDPFVRDIFLPLSVGGEIVMIQKEDILSPRRLLDLIVQRRVNTILSIVPTMLRALLSSNQDVHLPNGQMRSILVSGERLFWEDILKARKLFGDSVGFFNLYGPTECTMTSTHLGVPIEIEGKGMLGIGNPIPNVHLYILGSRLNLLPLGVPGDLYIGGIGIARGYSGHPDLTAEAFLPDPYSTEPGARMYRTGDRARVLVDGQLEFIGRSDMQVKVRGIRVEPGEIEAVLREHTAVRDCAVVPMKENDLETRLNAYLVLRTRNKFMEDELRRFVSQRLPEYMIPSSFVILDNLPLTVTGKVDRKKLPLEMLEDLGDSSYQAPSSATEETISRFFAELLGKKKIGVNDNFFELGGHSLMAMRLILRLGEEFDLDIPLRIFLENPNVAALAAIIDSSTGLFKKPDMLPSDFEEGEI